MSLFSRWNGTVQLPALEERRLKVGRNVIVQSVFGGATTKARISDSQVKGHDLVRTDLAPPYHELLLRRKGAKRVQTAMPVIFSNDINDYDALPATFDIKWESLGELATYADTPEKVLAAWTNKFNFRTENDDVGLAGLRVPQIGALHAISAHFSVGEKFEPATVVLPTGTGKTETMLATQVYRQLPKTLVLVPSDALRSQIAGKFVSLGILPTEAKVVPREIAKPWVAVISSGIASADDARSIVSAANVIITLPNTLKASHPEAVAVLSEACSDLIVDEAHHVPADTWARIRDKFQHKHILQFTATPFRQDGRRIDGKIIFNYKLGDAQKADYYKPIHLKTLLEFGDQTARDRAIAAAAIEVLRHDREKLGLDHLLMARTGTKDEADAVVAIYEELAPDFKPQVIYTGTGRALLNKAAKEKLFDRGPDGARVIVCVDMLGEGFDLPNLKIAALHDTHKSIAVTLQFIGRFTRRGSKEMRDKIGDATVITNIADPNAEKKLAALYAEGADWDHIIRRLSEETIEKELALQDVVNKLKQGGTLHDELSLWNLTPPLSAQFFRTTCAEWTPLEYATTLPKKAETWHSLDDQDNILVAVVYRTAEVGWGEYENVFDTVYDLIVARWDKANGSLAVFASDYNALRSEKMAQAMTGGTATLVSGDPIFNVLNNVEFPLVKQLGSSRVGAISFTSYFGSNVTEGLENIEEKKSLLNNIACVGYEDGERVLWGATQKRGKVWRHQRGTIADWLDWTALTWGKVASEDDLAPNITRNFLRPKRIDGAYGSHPIAAQWGEQAQHRLNERQFVLFGAKEVPLFAVDVQVAGVSASGAIQINFVTESETSQYELRIDGSLANGYEHVHISGPTLSFKPNRTDALPIAEYLQKDPLVVRYVDGTYSYNCWHIPIPLEADLFDKDKLEVWDWSGVPLNKESMHKDRNAATIQARTFEKVKLGYDLIFNDDGPGEAADLVCLKDVDETTIRLCFIHCKGAHKAKTSQDIRNFYTVCGQAQKSVVSKHMGLPKLYLDLKRRHDAWMVEGASRFLKGDIAKLAFFRDKARRSTLEFEMLLVQPGASLATITDDARRLLATTELYVFKTTNAKLRVVISK